MCVYIYIYIYIYIKINQKLKTELIPSVESFIGLAV